MKKKDELKENISAIRPDESSLFMERETGVTQSAFSRELPLFMSIRDGDVKTHRRLSEEYIRAGFVMGNMSDNALRQYKYWAVSTIAVAVHYAILGGMDETDAYNLSDLCIRHIDETEDADTILPYLLEKATDLTYGVYNAKANRACSAPVRRCIHYIHVHLHEKITVDDLSEECALTRSYLSVLFKKELGISPHDYILNEKLSAAVTMLKAGTPYSDIAYRLGFSSESHFISSFKKKYGVTPREYKLNH